MLTIMDIKLSKTPPVYTINRTVQKEAFLYLFLPSKICIPNFILYERDLKHPR